MGPTAGPGRVGAALGALLALLAAPLPGVAAGVPGQIGRRAEAYHLFSRAQQALLRRDIAAGLQLMERAAARDATPALLLELARLRYTLHQLDRAETLAERILAADHDYPGLARLLGDIHLGRAQAGEEPEHNVARAIGAYRRALEHDPTDLDACRPLAQLLYRSGRMEETVDLLRAFSRRQGLDSSLALVLGRASLRAGHLQEAEEVLAQLVGGSPLNVEAVDALAALYEQTERYEDAIGLYRRVLESAAPSGHLLGRLGSLYLQLGRTEEAVRLLEEARRLEPADRDGLLALARAYERTAEPDRALRIYGLLASRDGDDLEVRFYKARLEQEEGDRAAALAAYREIVDLAGRDAAEDADSATVLELAYSQIGVIELEARNFPAAAAAFARALEVSADPGPELYLLLGRSSLEDGLTGEADSVLEEAARRFPADIDVQVLRGEVLLARGDAARARHFYRSLLREHGRTPQAYVKIAQALLRRERFGEAERILEDGTRRHPADDALFFARGAANERMGRIEAAERYLSRAIDLNPSNAMALNYLGYMLAERGRKLPESIRYVERALALDPANPAYLDSLGWAQFKMSLYGPAEENLRAAVRYDRSDPTIREHLGDLYAATGRTEQAIREWENALARDPEDPDRLRSKVERARGLLETHP
ncbi:MAG: tetratricopeptide repeat protein [Acidobacteriota bacterium]